MTSTEPIRGSDSGAGSPGVPGDFAAKIVAALGRRKPLLDSERTQAWRALGGEADGVSGVYVDVYGPGAVMNVYEGRTPEGFRPETAAEIVLGLLSPLGVRGVYHKPFARDRSKLGGELPAGVTEAMPIAGEAVDEAVLIREHGWTLEARLYDGLSTGLFLDQRDNRAFVHEWVGGRLKAVGGGGNGGKGGSESGGGVSMLNTFAYTCAFSVAAAKAGAVTASVDVSGRYLDWGKRNFEHNGIDAAGHRFAKMDTFEFFGYAQRKGLKFDLIVLDPPSFASGSKKKGVRPWSSVADYARLVAGAAGLLKEGGVVLASTNTQELCRPGRLEREIEKGLGSRKPRGVRLPAVPEDFVGERDRFAARAFTIA